MACGLRLIKFKSEVEDMNMNQAAQEENLQFDHMEFEDTGNQAPPSCSRCSKDFTDDYYEADGKMICRTCKSRIETEMTGGSGAARFVKALVLGVPAAAIGAGIYYGISALTGYEFGLVAIVIGLLVGGAVRVGSNGRGGWLYQAMAVALTYCAIVSTYIPYIIEGLKNEPAMAQQSDAGQTADDAGATHLPVTAPPEAEPSEAVPPPVDDAGGSASDQGEIEYQPILAIGAMLVLFLFAMAAPFLAGFENIIGLIIIGIGLYEAWKINKRTEIQINGPFNLEPVPAAAESATANG